MLIDVQTQPALREMKGARAALPPNQPRVHSSGSRRGDACAGSARREEEEGEEGDAADGEALAPALGLLIRLQGLIPEVPRGESGPSGLPEGRLLGRLGMAGNHRHHCRECSLPIAAPSPQAVPLPRHSPMSPAAL